MEFWVLARLVMGVGMKFEDCHFRKVTSVAWEVLGKLSHGYWLGRIKREADRHQTRLLRTSEF